MDSSIKKYYHKLSEADLENTIKNSTKNIKDDKLIEQISNHIRRIYCNKVVKIDWFNETKLRKHDFINKALEKINKKNPNYLEIGVLENDNFKIIKTENKISVDPDPNAYPTFLGTSNEFFKGNKKKFDVILIDGLHTFDQCREDAINALNCLNKNGYIFFHDFIPRNFIEEYVPRIGGIWTGDVWKVSVELSKTIGIKFKVILADHGLGFLRKLEDNVKYFEDDRRKLIYSIYDDFFELNKNINYQNAELAYEEFL